MNQQLTQAYKIGYKRVKGIKRLIIFICQRYSVMQSDVDSFTKAYREENNNLDQIYQIKYVWITFMVI